MKLSSSILLLCCGVEAFQGWNPALTRSRLIVAQQQPQHEPSASMLLASTLGTDTKPSTEKADNDKRSNSNKNKPRSFQDRLTSSGAASAAAMATAAVNAAVAMKALEAPDLSKSYISLNRTLTPADIDEEGLPLVYDKDLIEAYWSKERGALNQRWGTFVGKAVPFLTKIITLFIRDGTILEKEIPALSRQARLDLQDLGPTFIKLGQVLSVRPDVLPQAALDELAKLQDAVVPFSTTVAVQQIEQELGGPLGQFFTSISEEPVAAASLAQVYLATLNDGKDTRVAVKVQRPNVLSMVSKDLYVLRRAAEVWQGLVERFAPQQKTNYVALLNEWAIGFYTELDFQNEAANQRALRQLLQEEGVTGIMVPRVFDELCTRRILVSEWVDGKKLSQCPPEVIKEVTPDAQEAFLAQLFGSTSEINLFHGDPHPGNLLYLNEPKDGARLAIIDCGLMASVDPVDRDNMISSLIHLANKDYAALVDDFIRLKILPEDCNRPAIIPLMDKALSPYVKGGGAKMYEEELKKIYGMEEGSLQSQVGGFQAMTQDALTVLNDIPFTIPPYFALLGRAIVTLEGVALSGDPSYAIIRSSYPYVARQLLSEGRPEIQKALQEVLYSGSGENSGLKLTRLLALLNNAAGAVATQAGAAFVDLDTIPDDGISLGQGLKFVLSEKAGSLRTLLEKEMDSIVDVLSRQIFRRAVSEAIVAMTPPRPPALPFIGDILPPTPALDEVPLPILLPAVGDESLRTPSLGILSIKDLTDVLAPKLDRDEEIFAIGLAEGAREFLGDDIADLLKGEKVLSPKTVQTAIKAARSGVLGRSDLLSSNAAKSVLQFVDQALAVTGYRDSLFDDTQLADASCRCTNDNLLGWIDRIQQHCRNQ